MRVIGIDPGSQYLGLGCVEAKGNSFQWIGHRVVKVVKDTNDLSDRLKRIVLAVQEAMDLWKPTAISVEEVFFAKNAKSALTLGQARGAALVPAAIAGLPIFEYSATLVKQTVTGSGRAEKEQVQRMVRALLAGKAGAALEFDRADASDALAVAICHLQHRHKHLIIQSSQAKGKKLVEPSRER